ncbi:hypothetical protein JZ751_017865 [Albula glossodonta]|uniref:Uncharacterized protein n=1 Tax=Albula glossodonta TaxID=121402 RepID=A0A8T2PPL4_9TELE|nr:hypothetical protein JZ751_017865 [Albula glossodonta]
MNDFWFVGPIPYPNLQHGESSLAPGDLERLGTCDCESRISDLVPVRGKAYTLGPDENMKCSQQGTESPFPSLSRHIVPF